MQFSLSELNLTIQVTNKTTETDFLFDWKIKKFTFGKDNMAMAFDYATKR